MPEEPKDQEPAVADASAGSSRSQADLDALDELWEITYASYTQDELTRELSNVFASLDHDLIDSLHNDKLRSGEFTVLGPLGGEGKTPNVYDMSPFLAKKGNLVETQMHMNPDVGAMVQTTIDLNDLEGIRDQVHQVIWLQKALKAR